METQNKLEIISRKIIKPSSSTSHQHRILKLSCLDQIFPPTYGCLVFFYNSNTNDGDNHSSFLERSNSLQKSLSKTLVHFYPFAGRLKDSSTIECNDEGVYFIEAQINCNLFEILNQPKSETLDQLLNPSKDPKTTQLATNSIFIVQLTAFKCGGIAIFVCVSHKLVDAASACAFVQSWTNLTCDDDMVLASPKFIGGSLMPPRELKDLLAFPISDTLLGNQIIPTKSRRFVFSASKLDSLKAKTASNSEIPINPTNVELVTAMVFKCAIQAASQSSEGFKPSLISQTVNLRKRMIPPLPENAIGNLISAFPVLVEGKGIELHEIVAKMRKGFQEFCEKKANRFKGDEGFLVLLETVRTIGEHATKGTNMYDCSSLCNFPFYEMDFGWGKPIWFTCPVFYRNVFALMDTKWGGIEVWVTLEEKEMASFERDEEILAFASINPGVIDTYARI
ncbi:hypothetical protein UlMin_006391 [Ulmus minor]